MFLSVMSHHDCREFALFYVYCDGVKTLERLFSGTTALQLAAAKGHTNIVERLLQVNWEQLINVSHVSYILQRKEGNVLCNNCYDTLNTHF